MTDLPAHHDLQLAYGHSAFTTTKANKSLQIAHMQVALEDMTRIMDDHPALLCHGVLRAGQAFELAATLGNDNMRQSALALGRLVCEPLRIDAASQTTADIAALNAAFHNVGHHPHTPPELCTLYSEMTYYLRVKQGLYYKHTHTLDQE